MSAQSFSSLNGASVRQSFMLGLNRNPLALPEEIAQAIRARTPGAQPALTALALAGTRSRFARPAPAQAAEAIPEAARRLHADSRSILPAQARRLLNRLLVKADSELARLFVAAALKRLNACGLRLHPFDLPRLAVPLRTSGVPLGIAERASLELLRTGADEDEDAAGNLAYAVISAENWQSFGKTARARFLHDMRHTDPDGARALLEACFPREPAAVRSELLQTLRTGISGGDRAFLETCGGDRAESVRSAAALLLAKLPGTDAYQERLDRAKAYFTIKPARLPGSANVTFTPPGSAGRTARDPDIYKLLEDLPAAEVAARLNLAADAFLKALPASENAVRDAFIRTAFASGDMTTIGALLPQLGDERLDFLMGYLPGYGALPEARAALFDRFAARCESGTYARDYALRGVVESVDRPLPDAIAARLLASSGWRAFVSSLAEDENGRSKADPIELIYTAMLMPRGYMEQFLSAIEPLPPAVNRKARDFAHFVLALPASAPDER
ncbi:MAG: DUF5691 domain-containing protein [Rhodomicrobium sp.]